MNKDILEGNKLIAEFMGLKFRIQDYPNGQTNIPEVDMGSYWARAKYDSSWDWLMPVVEKIESVTTVDGRGEVNYIMSIEPGICIISVGGESPVVEVQGDNKILNVWQAVVDFIKLYNSQP